MDTLSFKTSVSSATVSPGDSLAVTITFRPSQEITFFDTLAIENNDSTLSVFLRGQGKAPLRPIISLSSDSLQFGKSYLYSESTKDFVVSNTGTAEFRIDSIRVSDLGAFAINLDSTSIAPGDSLMVSVLFAPTYEAIFLDSIKIFSDSTELLLYLAGEGESALSVESSSGNLTSNDTTGYYQVWLKLNKMEGNPVVKLLLDRDGADSFPDTLDCQPDTTPGLFSVSIPAGSEGAVWNYYFEVASSWGEIKREPLDAPQSSFAIKVTAQVAGDLDGNGRINIFDLLDLLKQLNNPSQSTGLGDVDGNGKVDIFDLLSLLKKISSKE